MLFDNGDGITCYLTRTGVALLRCLGDDGIKKGRINRPFADPIGIFY